MSIASKYNKTHVFTFQIPKDFEYRSLIDLFNNNGKNHVYKVNAIYINKKSRFGESPVVVTDTCLVNLPQHLTDVAREIMRDEETVTAINNGKFGFTIYPYETQNRKEVCYSVNWVDC